MRISGVMLALCAATLLVTGCAKNQMPAKKAVEEIETSLNAVKADAQRYAPDGLKSVESQLARFKADIEAKHYDDVVAGAPQLKKAVDSLQDAVALGKKHAQEAVELAKSEWASLSEEVPKMVETIDARVKELDKKKFFRGVKKEDLEGAKTTLDSMKSLWAEASDAFKSGKPVAAADKAKSVKSMGDELYQKLEIKTT
jgi:PHD/YefM family antitoxin component YafN of YafNO toxin-antitoxin module